MILQLVVENDGKNKHALQMRASGVRLFLLQCFN